jgi:hypothetical protein
VQTTPQLPQLFGSVAVITHAPLQLICPAGHVQEPPTQLWPAAQMLPHWPQFATLVIRSTQLDPHGVPLAHSVPQVPCEQTVPTGHTLPHVPQLFPSELRSAHVVPQVVRPARHVHSPPWQSCPGAHVFPQLPQL